MRKTGGEEMDNAFDNLNEKAFSFSMPKDQKPIERIKSKEVSMLQADFGVISGIDKES